ncbi:acyl-CoA dehydrogenase family protein [Kribbella sp. NPDC056951]|uniref:acyl-CoA dehydrogenase family protein n=1 Tax=Kribbella sp. NPDC056951 TaxID=3345978 RepID=UPI003632AEA4
MTTPDYDELAGRFRPIFERIAKNAVQRERERELPFEEIEWLREAGFGALRVPVEYGGSGASLPQLFRLLIELGAADSNLPQLLRGHFAFTESRIVDADLEARERWGREIASGSLVGNASSELGTTSLAEPRTALTQDGDRWLLNGTKYYSTGTLFADWISVGGVQTGERVSVSVRSDAPGVTRTDDWDGFGQRLTGSGTTVFDGVEVAADNIYRWRDRGPSHLLAFFQLVLLATLAGIGRAVVRDAVDFVQPRTRAYPASVDPVPRQDPLVQQVIGRLSASSFTVDATVLAAAEQVGLAADAAYDGSLTQELVDAAEIAAYQAQVTVIDLVLTSATTLFEVGGASATSHTRQLDRHWRNARTVASHNPAIYKSRLIGDHLLNDVSPGAVWAARR